MNNYISNIENPWVRRSLIILMVLCAAPFLLALLIAEVLWKTAKVMVEIVKTQVKETAPSIKGTINYIREIW